MERRFEEELEALKRNLLTMGARVEKNIGDALRALIERDAALAESILTRDLEVDRQELEIDERCLAMLALRQPVAGDLRFVATALKIVKDLERVGDMAVDIAERALDIMQDPPMKPFIDLPIMARAALDMLKRALDAFVRRDVELARQVIEDDDQVDELQEKIFAELVELMTEDRALVRQGTHLASVTKYLERTGDHSSNIAEMVIFLVEARDIRHYSKLSPPES